MEYPFLHAEGHQVWFEHTDLLRSSRSAGRPDRHISRDCSGRSRGRERLEQALQQEENTNAQVRDAKVRAEAYRVINHVAAAALANMVMMATCCASGTGCFDDDGWRASSLATTSSYDARRTQSRFHRAAAVQLVPLGPRACECERGASTRRRWRIVSRRAVCWTIWAWRDAPGTGRRRDGCETCAF